MDRDTKQRGGTSKDGWLDVAEFNEGRPKWPRPSENFALQPVRAHINTRHVRGLSRCCTLVTKFHSAVRLRSEYGVTEIYLAGRQRRFVGNKTVHDNSRRAERKQGHLAQGR